MKKIFGMVSTAKSAEYTWHALRTFYASTPLEPGDEFHLIDNDSGSVDAVRLQKEFPQVILHSNSEQRSFAANMNLAMHRADEIEADSYLLNNDIIFAPNWFQPLAIEKRWVISPVSNAQFHYHHNGLNFQLSMKLTDYLGREETFLEIVKSHQAAQGGYKLTHSLPYYCVKIPRSVYSEVGFLDETYSKAGYEDSDYIVRCWEKGIPLYYALGSFVLHFYGKSSWAADSGPLPVDPDPRIGQRGDMLFRKRWGDLMAEIFAVQSPLGQQRLKELEAQAIFNLYVQLARQARAFRDKQGEILDP